MTGLRQQTLIDICVCTYRRPELESTLRSLGTLEVPPDTTVRIIVADNDVLPSAHALVVLFAPNSVRCPLRPLSGGEYPDRRECLSRQLQRRFPGVDRR